MHFKLNILGTASALPMINRYPSAQVLDVRGRLFLIDCGEGVQVQMRRMGLSFLKLDAVFISHIHGDHVFGIFGLLSTMGLLGRTGKLEIFAPRSFGPVLKFFLSYFGDGLKYEIEHHPLTMKEPEEIYATKSLKVSAFPLNHKIDCFGYLFQEAEPQLNVHKIDVATRSLSLEEIATAKRGEDIYRENGEVILNSDICYKPYEPASYAYCSDTAPFDELPQWVSGVNLLYHEATYLAEMEDKAAERFHSSARQAALCAKNSGAGRLILGHYSSKYKDLNPLLDEARAVFENTDLAFDGMVIEL